MKNNPQDFQNSDAPLEGRGTAEQARQKLTAVIDEFLMSQSPEQRKMFMQDLMRGKSGIRTGANEFWRKIEESGTEVSPHEVVSLLEERMLGFEETQRTKIESPWADQSVLDEQRTLLRKVPLGSNNDEDNAAAVAVQEVQAGKGVLPPTSPWSKKTEASARIHHFFNELPEETKISILPDYLKVDRNNRRQVDELRDKHGVAALKLDHDLSELAEKIGCSVDTLRGALGMVLKGERVVIDNLRQKVIINPDADPRRAKTVLISRKQREESSVLERARTGIKRFFSKDR